MKMPLQYRVSGPFAGKARKGSYKKGVWGKPPVIARLSSLADAKRALKARVNNED